MDEIGVSHQLIKEKIIRNTIFIGTKLKKKIKSKVTRIISYHYYLRDEIKSLDS